MRRLLRAGAGILSYSIFRFLYPSRELLVIETNIFGHAILESALLSEYAHKNPEKSVCYVLHPYSANQFLTKSIVQTLKNIKLKESKLARNAIHGEDILINRLGIDKKLKTVEFQEELTHLTASKLKEEHLPIFNFRPDLDHGSVKSKKTVIFMNRSAAYKKFQESSNLHSYRDFDFSAIDSLDIKTSDTMNFVRIGVPDGIPTGNTNINDLRAEIASDPELDMKLQSSADGYFGADSGPAWFALALNKPVAFINMIPLNQVSPLDARKLVVIPKLIYSENLGRVLTISEMLSPEVSKLRNSADYNAANLETITNSSQDVSNFFEDWLYMISGSRDIVDEAYMRHLRSKFQVPNLPSIHTRFIENHPEVFADE
jgi:putative glycosyltransferase (TIGR04372 family)